MSHEEGSSGTVELVGLTVEEATEGVLAADDSRDPATVRAALESVAADGVVSRGAIHEALAETAKAVSTPETRAELAAIELDRARETAETEGVSGLDAVRAHLDDYRARLDAVGERIEALGPRLREVIDRRGDPGAAYEVALELRELGAEANECQLVADELQQDVEAFGRWLTTPEIRYDEFEEEVETVEGSLDDLAGTIDALETAGEDATDDAATSSDPAAVWAESAIQTRVLELLVTDLRAELDDLRAWPTGRGTDTDAPERTEALGERLDGIEKRRGALAERLGDLARPAWSERLGAHVEGIEDTLSEFEPPVAWGEVEAALERHRAELEA